MIIENSKLKIKPQSGFTVIEVLIVITVIAFTAGVAIFMSGDFFHSNSFQSDVNSLGVSLQRARNQSINNINEKAHGVKIIDGDYIIFEGNDYDTATDTQTIGGNSNYTYTFTPSNPDSEILFGQLSGNSSFNGIIVISDGFKTATISINSWGRIDF